MTKGNWCMVVPFMGGHHYREECHTSSEDLVLFFHRIETATHTLQIAELKDGIGQMKPASWSSLGDGQTHCGRTQAVK